jgi:hypothetical protein
MLLLCFSKKKNRFDRHTHNLWIGHIVDMWSLDITRLEERAPDRFLKGKTSYKVKDTVCEVPPITISSSYRHPVL